jgi:hypothetical protein
MFRIAIAGTALLLCGLAQERKMPEYELKAGFLYNFAKYVEWPAKAFKDKDSPIVIAVIGKDPFGEHLEKTLKDRQAQNRRFTIERYADVDELQPCHILFIPRTEKGREEIFKKIEGWPTLTVGEAEGFAVRGGAVNILIEKDRPILEINPEVVERSKLVVQARLLKLATLVKTEK